MLRLEPLDVSNAFKSLFLLNQLKIDTFLENLDADTNINTNSSNLIIDLSEFSL